MLGVFPFGYQEYTNCFYMGQEMIEKIPNYSRLLVFIDIMVATQGSVQTKFEHPYIWYARFFKIEISIQLYKPIESSPGILPDYTY